MVAFAKVVFGAIFFPVLVPVAFVHLIVAGTVMFAKKVLGNLKPILKGILNFIGFLIFGATVARRWGSIVKDTTDAGIQNLSLGAYFAVYAIFNLVACGSAGGVVPNWWWDNKWIFLGVVATNVLSGFYEIGRWYWNSVLKKNSGRNVPEQPKVEEVMREAPAPMKMEAKPTTPKQDDDDPNDKFEELITELSNLITDGFTEEAIMRFIEKVMEIFKEGELKQEQYNTLMEMADKARRNRSPKPAAA